MSRRKKPNFGDSMRSLHRAAWAHSWKAAVRPWFTVGGQETSDLHEVWECICCDYRVYRHGDIPPPVLIGPKCNKEVARKVIQS